MPTTRTLILGTTHHGADGSHVPACGIRNLWALGFGKGLRRLRGLFIVMRVASNRSISLDWPLVFCPVTLYNIFQYARLDVGVAHIQGRSFQVTTNFRVILTHVKRVSARISERFHGRSSYEVTVPTNMERAVVIGGDLNPSQDSWK